MKIVNLIVLFLIISCSSVPTQNQREYQLNSYLWYQTSGEFRALCYQAYNLARMRLDQNLLTKSEKPKAVIFDIDETVLDNSASGAYELKNNLAWDKDRFNQWVTKASAPEIAGATEFINYAKSKNVKVIFVTNRLEFQILDSIKNFNSLGIKAHPEDFYPLKNQWGKEGRRIEIQKNYEVVLYLGDNLHDFHKDWDSVNSQERRKRVDQHSSDFGSKFIILPNPLYGDWESSLPKNVDRLNLLKID
jgi:5'-nucleotidase (lipoprotein e(P4) family)